MPIFLNDREIPYCEETTHLGVLRCASASNMPHILNRMSAHRKVLFSLLPAGIARRHGANPSAGLKIERMYALPVLLSGLPSLVLLKSELDIVYRHHKDTIKRIMKLPEDTSDCAVFFIAGSLPSTAILHLRILSLFSMICKLPGNILQSVGFSALTVAKPSARSWFQEVRNLCIQYNLPHPINLLQSPEQPEKFKAVCKANVMEYWHARLSRKTRELNLPFLKPEYLSLLKSHPIWTSLKSGNQYQVRAAIIQASFLSGRYRTERLRRHWSSNYEGICLMDSCKNLKLLDDVEHILLHCDGLSAERRRLRQFILTYTVKLPHIREIALHYLSSSITEECCQFIVDCSVLPMVIQAVQNYGDEVHTHCFRVTRTWCRLIHDTRLRKLGRYPS